MVPKYSQMYGLPLDLPGYTLKENCPPPPPPVCIARDGQEREGDLGIVGGEGKYS